MSNSLRVLVTCVLVLTFGVTATFGQSSRYDVSNMDPKTAACADFYQYANGGWLAANPIPAAYPAWGIANVLNEKNRDVLREILEGAGASVTAMTTAAETRAFLGCSGTDLLIADIGMPLEDGYALIRAVRSARDEQVRRLPAIALTAYARIEDRLRVLSAGFQMHVPKPVEPLELITIVANVAEQRGARLLRERPLRATARGSVAGGRRAQRRRCAPRRRPCAPASPSSRSRRAASRRRSVMPAARARRVARARRRRAPRLRACRS